MLLCLKMCEDHINIPLKMLCGSYRQAFPTLTQLIKVMA